MISGQYFFSYLVCCLLENYAPSRKKKKNFLYLNNLTCGSTWGHNESRHAELIETRYLTWGVVD